jgi:YbbR domain-containing protein
MTLRRLILHNFWLKLVSIVLASLLWLVVQAGLQDSESATRRFARATASREFARRPVLVLTDMAGQRGFRAEPREVSVTLSGPDITVEQLRESDLQAYVELMAPAKMKGEMPFKVQVQMPRGLKLEKVSPETVVVRPVEAP